MQYAGVMVSSEADINPVGFEIYERNIRLSAWCLGPANPPAICPSRNRCARLIVIVIERTASRTAVCVARGVVSIDSYALQMPPVGAVGVRWHASDGTCQSEVRL